MFDRVKRSAINPVNVYFCTLTLNLDGLDLSVTDAVFSKAGDGCFTSNRRLFYAIILTMLSKVAKVSQRVARARKSFTKGTGLELVVLDMTKNMIDTFVAR